MNAVEKIEPQPRAVAAVTPMDMLNRAVESGAGLDMVEKLMSLQERWETGQARKAFDRAIAAAKAKITPIQRNAKGHNDKRYADFAAIAKVVDPILSEHGLSYRFRTAQSDRISVTCILSHEDGHSEETTLSGPADTSGSKNAIQAIGSTLTYLQRYSLVQMLGLAAAADDDGKAGAGVAAITQEQADAIRELLEANGKDRAKFLRWAKVEQIEQIPADYYESCVNAIKGSGSQMMQIIECEQGTPEWFAARAGIPTASEFHTVMAVGAKGGKSLTRVAYLNKLAGEVLTGEPMGSYSNGDMERGKLMEDEARDLYAFQNGADPQRVGFVRNGEKGASPDSLIGDKGGLEIKSAAAHIQIARLLDGGLPSEHKAQVQGSLWVCEREWWDFCSYCPKLPLLQVRVFRDEEYIKKIASEVELFNIELQQTVDFIRRYGQKAAA